MRNLILRNFLAIIGVTAISLSAGPTKALMCDEVECGLDNDLIVKDLLNKSGEGRPVSWVEHPLYDLAHVKNISRPAAQFVDGATDLAYEPLPAGTTTFVAKVGQSPVVSGGQSHFLYENLANALFGTIHSSEEGMKNIGAISRYTSIVPLPASAWLLISAIVALFAVGRVRRSGGGA